MENGITRRWNQPKAIRKIKMELTNWNSNAVIYDSFFFYKQFAVSYTEKVEYPFVWLYD